METDRLRVDVPGGARDGGLKVAPTLAGRLLKLRDTAPAKPLVAARFTVKLAVLETTTFCEPGLTDIKKSGMGTMVRLMAAAWRRLPLVPVTVTVARPVVAVLLAVKVKVLFVVVSEGLNEAETPPGKPDAEKPTLPLKPLVGTTVMVLKPLLPWVMVRLFGEAESEKLGPVNWMTVRVTVVE